MKDIAQISMEQILQKCLFCSLHMIILFEMTDTIPWKCKLGQIVHCHLCEVLYWKALALESTFHLLVCCWPGFPFGSDLCH